MADPSRFIQRSTIDDVLKDDYEDTLYESFRSGDNYMYEMHCGKANGTIRGSKLIIKNQLYHPAGGGFGLEQDAFPYPNAPDFAEFQLGLAWLRGTGLVTKQAEDDSKGDLSWIEAWDKAQSDLVMALKRLASLQMYSNRWTFLASVSEATITSPAASATVIYLKDGQAASATETWEGTYDDCGARRILENSYVSFIKKDGTRIAQAADAAAFIFQVTGRTSTSITVTPAVHEDISDVLVVSPAVAGDLGKGVRVVPMESFNLGVDGSFAGVGQADIAGEAAAGPRGKGTYGWEEIVSNDSYNMSGLYGDYGAYDRSSTNVFESTVVDKAYGDLNEDDLEDLLDAIEGKCGKSLDENGVLSSHRSVFKVIKRWNSDDIRYEARMSPLGMPDGSVSWVNGEKVHRFHVDAQCPARTLWAMNRNELQVYENIKLQFVDDDNHILRMSRDPTTGRMRDMWEFGMRQRYQIFSALPQAHGKIVRIGGTRPQYGQNESFVESF